MSERAVLVDLRKSSEHQPIAGGCLKTWAMADPQLKARARITLLAPLMDAPARELAGPIAALRPKLVGFSCYVWNMSKVTEVARELKRADPAVRVLVGGPEAAPLTEKVLQREPAVDYVALGEGEETFRRLLRSLILEDEPLSGVPGLAYRGPDAVNKTEAPPQIELAEGSSPYLSGAIEAPSGPGAPRRAIMETSRGCPFTCKFCEWGPRNMRYAPLSRIRREFELLARRYESIELCDSDLLMHKSRGIEVLKLFLEATKGSRCMLFFNTNPVYLVPEAVDVMSEHPAKFGVFAGVQTTNPAVLSKISRNLDLEKTERNLADLRRKAAGVHLN